MSDEAYWFIALGFGLIVSLVAVVLLEVFLRQVHRIERGAGLVWEAGKQVAGNTATTWMLDTTSERLSMLTKEAGRHVDLLSPASPSATVRSIPKAGAR